jgi:AAA family ATP:ADP antiporter
MFKRIASALWGKFENKEEVIKFVSLGFIFMLILGTYWAFRPMKDSIFNTIVGLKEWQPIAKWLSLVVSFPLLFLYAKLIDLFPRHKVFYMITLFYGCLAIFFTWAFMHPEIGLANAVASPSRLIGWAWYVYVESFGSLIVALFWAISSDITMPDAAKRGFPLIVMIGQMGNIVGPYWLRAKRLGFENSAPVVGICAAFIFGMAALMWLFMHLMPKSQLTGYHGHEGEAAEEEPKFFEGLKLLLTRGYLMAIFLIVSIYEVVITVVDYLFKTTYANQLIEQGVPKNLTEALLGEYLADYAVWVGIIAFCSVLFGINNIQRKLGMTASLVSMPLLTAVLVLTVWYNPTDVYVLSWVMVFAKAVNYALNGPTIKQLYIPTTKEAKYKAQSWIEMFGSRSAKGVGAYINTFMKKLGSVSAFLNFSTMTSLALIGGWMLVVVYAATMYNRAIKEKRVVC